MARAQATGDTPRISTSTYATSTYAPSAQGLVSVGSTAGQPTQDMLWSNVIHGNRSLHIWNQEDGFQKQDFNPKENLRKVVNNIKKDLENNMGLRIVQVYIADTDENVPVENRILYSGTQKLTDATDQELFFEIGIKEILDKHNTYRATLVNKKIKERTENLEPVKIRDLKMVVVNIATF